MKKIIATTSKGRVTIPAEVRQYLGLKTNDKVVFVIESEGEVRLRGPRYHDIASLRGAAGTLNKTLTWMQLEEIAHEDRL
jgi:AbrB family looped-hinge helix DNA binding protein